ncbi:hypothetical protein [Rhodococcoides navarretei]|uniref:Uncharacterized protein n=1 Tax=Rhodococcus navarretei TaxID=3128981 RepID=A0ABU9CQP4_9NOCA
MVPSRIGKPSNEAPSGSSGSMSSGRTEWLVMVDPLSGAGATGWCDGWLSS